MELEEMQTLWTEMSVKLEDQKKITDSLIIKMTQTNYHNRLNKIYIPEFVGTIMCFAAIVYLLANFQKLNSGYILASTIVTILIAGILPVLSLRAICKMRSINIAGNSYKETLEAYSKSKIGFMQVQKANLFITPILMLASIPVISKLMNVPDLLNSKHWVLYISAVFVCAVFARWIYKCYDKTTIQMENLLKELVE